MHRGSLSPINAQVAGFGELVHSQTEGAGANRQGNSTPGSMQIQSSSKLGSYNGLGESSSMLRSLDTGQKRGSSSNKNRPVAAAGQSKGDLQNSQMRSLQESGLERDLSLMQNAIFSGGLAPNMIWDPVKQEFVRQKNTIESDSGLNTPKVMSSGNTGKASPRMLGYPQIRPNPAKEFSKPPYLAVVAQSQLKLYSEGDSESVPSNSQTPRVNLIKNQPSPGLDFRPPIRPLQPGLLQLQEDQDESGTPEVSKRVSSSGGLGENSSNWNFHDSSRGQNPAYAGQSSHTTSRVPSRFIEDDDDDDY